MQAVTHAATHEAPITTTRPWIGRGISALAALFLLFDGVIKVLQLAPAVDGSVQLGFPAHLTPDLGLLLLTCLLVYVIPRTAPLGAILLTGYLGGAVATHVRIGAPPFPVVFPIVIGALLWGGLFLRDSRLRALLSRRR